MDKLKFIGAVIAGMAVFYLFLTILMPLFVTVSTDTATTIGNDPHADAYGLSIFGVQYLPLLLYFIPAAIGMTLIFLKLRSAK